MAEYIGWKSSLTAALGKIGETLAVRQVALTSNLIYTIPEGTPSGIVHRVVFTQDGTGGHTVTYDDVPLTIDTTAGATTLVEVWPGGKVAYPGATGSGSLDTEAAQDVVGAMVTAAGGTYDDGAGTITLPAGAGEMVEASQEVMNALSNLPATVAYNVRLGIEFDNSAIIQAYVDALSAAGGGVVLLPPGVIRTVAAVIPRDNVIIRGAGRDATIWKPEKTAMSYSGDGVNQANPIRGAGVTDLTIDGSNQTALYKGIAWQYCIGCVFSRLRIKNTQMTALGVDFLKNTIISDVITEDSGLGNDGTMPGGNGIGIGIGGFSDQEETALVIGCHVYRAKRSGIMFEKSGLPSAKGYRCIGNYATGCGDVGIHDCGACGLITLGNVSSQNTGHGFAVSQATLGVSGAGYAGTMAHNYAFKNGKAGYCFDTTPLAMVGPGYLIEGNLASDNSQEGYVVLTGDSDITGLILRGNRAHRNTGSGIRLKATGTGKLVSGVIADNYLMGNGRSGGTAVNNLLIDIVLDRCELKYNTSRTGTTTSPTVGIRAVTGKTHNKTILSGNSSIGMETPWSVAGTWTGCWTAGNITDESGSLTELALA